jgi:hypothetical protein
MLRTYRKSLVCATLFLLSLTLALLGVNDVIPMGRVPGLLGVNAALGNIFFFSLFWLIPSERKAARTARGTPTRGAEVGIEVPNGDVPGKALAFAAGFCWLMALAGIFIPIQLEDNHLFDFWGFGASGAIFCTPIWVVLGSYISSEVSRLAIRKGSSLRVIVANAFLTLLAGVAILGVALAVGWGRK